MNQVVEELAASLHALTKERWPQLDCVHHRAHIRASCHLTPPLIYFLIVNFDHQITGSAFAFDYRNGDEDRSQSREWTICDYDDPELVSKVLEALEQVALKHKVYHG
jgi:hypothetical protein